LTQVRRGLRGLRRGRGKGGVIHGWRGVGLSGVGRGGLAVIELRPGEAAAGELGSANGWYQVCLLGPIVEIERLGRRVFVVREFDVAVGSGPDPFGTSSG